MVVGAIFLSLFLVLVGERDKRIIFIFLVHGHL